MNKILLLLTFFLFFISSCSLLKNIKKTNFFLEKEQFIFLSFENAIENVILEILNNKNIFFSKKISLYISTLKNKSNIFLENTKLIDIFKKTISKNIKKIHIVDIESINRTKEKLGLSKNNNTLSINEAILLSRNNNATYYLDSCVMGDNKPFLLKVQLILVKTGEIIFCKIQKFY
ncbi:hypothetical protein D9V76_01830 [Buchnera aphidicola (Rhopalosiphum padi)]|uniref:Lipoprotein n=1 Tax=Buchnera aphidicola subsp. Rhopalosiphum padi TaxID=98793 RepID=A0A4D6Y9G7_BUCRP|nr:hypothetical protein [Buchnera aphidicola]QCI24993.1 hypothetical protein D9V76_01830 [Buchnera aphidicola (Rhopalosiphum padi)]